VSGYVCSGLLLSITFQQATARDLLPLIQMTLNRLFTHNPDRKKIMVIYGRCFEHMLVFLYACTATDTNDQSLCISVSMYLCIPTESDAQSLTNEHKGLPLRQASITSLASSIASNHSGGGGVGSLLISRPSSIRSMGELLEAVNDTVMPPPPLSSIDPLNSTPNTVSINNGPVLFTSSIPLSSSGDSLFTQQSLGDGNSNGSIPQAIPGSTHEDRGRSNYHSGGGRRRNSATKQSGNGNGKTAHKPHSGLGHEGNSGSGWHGRGRGGGESSWGKRGSRGGNIQSRGYAGAVDNKPGRHDGQISRPRGGAEIHNGSGPRSSGKPRRGSNQGQHRGGVSGTAVSNSNRSDGGVGRGGGAWQQSGAAARGGRVNTTAASSSSSARGGRTDGGQQTNPGNVRVNSAASGAAGGNTSGGRQTTRGNARVNSSAVAGSAGGNTSGNGGIGVLVGGSGVSQVLSAAAAGGSNPLKPPTALDAPSKKRNSRNKKKTMNARAPVWTPK
jgi:hypothetical protein